ncbi:hypothetical protein ACHAPT_009012 [Fusarium lateritium]
MLDLIFLLICFISNFFWPEKSLRLVAPVRRGKAQKRKRHSNPFNVLPNELVVKIGTLLDPIDRACLAYTNRWAHNCMSRALRLAFPEAKAQFLARLDRDGFLPFDILCTKCNKFHPPRKTREWNAVEGRRKCIRDPNLDDSPYLPQNVFFDIVSAVSRSFRLKSGYYVVNCLADQQEYTTEGAKIKSKSWARIREGQVILKTENVLYLDRGPDLLHNVEKLHEMLMENWQLAMVCKHHSWDKIWPWILNPEIPDAEGYNYVLSRDPEKEALPLEHRDFTNCIWTHGMTCWTRCGATQWIRWHQDELWGCTSCSTDYKISVLRRPSGYSRTNAIVFTSWKNLGRGIDWSDKQWMEQIGSGDDRDSRSTWGNSSAVLFEDDKDLSFGSIYMPNSSIVW